MAHGMTNEAHGKDITRIALVGYMGAGKTTLGKALAEDLALSFYDLDWYIQNRMHKSVSQIFDERGEESFRLIERNMLHEVAEFEDVVISCGGGTPCFFDNMQYINQQAQSVYLKCHPDTLYAHLHMGRAVRPLLLGKNTDEMKKYIATQLEEREPYYLMAKHTVDVTLMDSCLKISNMVAKLKETLHIG